jgi:hypothetical protein
VKRVLPSWALFAVIIIVNCIEDDIDIAIADGYSMSINLNAEISDTVIVSAKIFVPVQTSKIPYQDKSRLC